MKQFECFWGDGYRSNDKKSTLAYYDLEFFNELRGYGDEEIHIVDMLEVGDRAEFNESGEHWVRRIA